MNPDSTPLLISGPKLLAVAADHEGRRALLGDEAHALSGRKKLT